MDEVHDTQEEQSQSPIQYTPVTEWITGEPDEEDFIKLRHILENIRKNKLLMENRDDYSDVPDHEWNTMEEYLDAMDFGIQIALNWQKKENEKDRCIEEGTCLVSMERYSNLDEPFIYHTNNITRTKFVM